jgi:hypothetical protein
MAAAMSQRVELATAIFTPMVFQDQTSYDEIKLLRFLNNNREVWQTMLEIAGHFGVSGNNLCMFPPILHKFIGEGVIETKWLDDKEGYRLTRSFCDLVAREQGKYCKKHWLNRPKKTA